MGSDLANYRSDIDSPASDGAGVTPHDTNELEVYSRAIFVGTGGNLAVVFVDGSSAVTLPNVQDGSVLPIRVKKVMSTNTTASNIVALY